MDPNSAYADIRAHISAARRAKNMEEYQRHVALLVENFEALDEWLSVNHGMLPYAWMTDEERERCLNEAAHQRGRDSA